MKVKELIKELQSYNQDLDVIVWSEELSDNHTIDTIEVDCVNNEELIINIH